MPRTRNGTSCHRRDGWCATSRPSSGPRTALPRGSISGVEEGGEISVYYDPMIAKLVTHAPKRLEAIEHMGSALDAFAIDGFRHNIPFLAVLMRNERWKEGRLSTKFIAQEFPDGFTPPRPRGEVRDTMVAVAAAIDHMSNQRRRAITQQMHGEPVRFAETRIVELGSERVRVTVDGTFNGPMTVTFGGTGKKERKIELMSSGGSARPSGKERSMAFPPPSRCAPFSTARCSPIEGSRFRRGSLRSARASLRR